ncbi:MAG: hypothetical protein SGARI_001890 [Bacillariaceae sp.]
MRILNVFLVVLLVPTHIEAFVPVARENLRDLALPDSLKTATRRLAASPRLAGPPPPPWRFQVSHIHYQFRWIKAEQAENHTPTNVKLLSFGGYTLGGLFCVAYENSPIGPYQEVAVLSGLVIKPSSLLFLPHIGAWASHILVDSEDAMTYGKKYWGLPAKVVDIEFDEGTIEGGTTISFINGANPAVKISGWSAKSNDHHQQSSFSWLNVSLPSLSGCLPILKDKGFSEVVSASPLLEYPLRIMNPESIRMLSSDAEEMTVQHINNESKQGDTWFEEIRQLLSGSKPSISVLIDNVELEAGVAKEI